MTDITFFAWGDTHFGYETKFADQDLRADIIKQMNELEGWPLPVELGGCVGKPDFVTLCGDVVDNGPEPKIMGFNYFQYFISKLNYKHYEVLGNHDEASEPFMKYWHEKYGPQRSYSFDCQNIHFISLTCDYDEAEQGWVNDQELNWLDNNLRIAGDNIPVVLFIHSRIDRLKNPDQVLQLLKKYRIILIVSAHIHIPEIFELSEIPCISLGHCRNHPQDPEFGRSFSVIHITEDRITAVPWKWEKKQWERCDGWNQPSERLKKMILDVKVK